MESRTKLGFTLIELLITLIIVAVIALISMPFLSDIIKFHRLSRTAEELFTNIQLARSEAVKNNANVYFSFQTGDAWCYGINGSTSCDCSTAGACALGSVRATNTGQISLSTSGFSSGTVIFDNTHASASSAGSITLTLFGRSEYIQINISKMGSTTMCSSDISGYTAC